MYAWLAVSAVFSAASAMANPEPNRSGWGNNDSTILLWHGNSSSHFVVHPPSPAHLLMGNDKPLEEGTPSPHERIVDRENRSFEIPLLDADDDIDPARP